MKIKHLIIAMAAAAGMLAACSKEPANGPAQNVTVTPTEIRDVPSTETSVKVKLTADGTWTAGYSNKDMIVKVSPDNGGACTDLEVTISVLANKGINRSASVSFGSSKLNSASVTIFQNGEKGDSDVEKLTVAEFIKRADGATVYRLEGEISNIADASYYGFDLEDATGKIAIAFPTNFKDMKSQLEVGATVVVEGTYQFYDQKQTHQMANGTIISVVAPKPIDPSTIQTLTIKEFIAKKDAKTVYRVVGSAYDISYTDKYKAFNLKDDSGETLCIYAPTNYDKFHEQMEEQCIVSVRGTYEYYESKQQHEMVGGVIESVEPAPVIPTIEVTRIADIVAADAGTKFLLKGATVAGVNKKGCLVSDGTDRILIYADKEVKVKIGDVVDVTGTSAEYAGLVQLTKPTIESKGTATYNHPEPVDITSSFDTYDLTKIQYVSVSGNLKIDGNYYNIIVDGATKTGSLQYPLDSFELSKKDGVACTAKGYLLGTTTSKAGAVFVNIMLIEIDINGDYFSVDPTTIRVAFDATEASFKVVTNAAWTVECPAGVTANPASGTGEAEVKLSFSANEQMASASFEVTVKTADKSATVKVNQAAAPDPNAKCMELTNEEICAALQKAVDGGANGYKNIEINSASGTWKGNINAQGKNGVLSTTYIQIRAKNGACFQSPTFSSNIVKIEFEVPAPLNFDDKNNVGLERNIYAVPVATELPSDKDYTVGLYETNYGYVTTVGNKTDDVVYTIEFTSDTKDFKLLSKGGASYINWIKVYLKSE